MAINTDLPEYDELDAVALAGLVRSRQVSSLEVTEAAIRRIEARNPALNAVTHRLYDAARAQAISPALDGPFAGVPILLKDNALHYAGTPLSNGSRGMQGFISVADSELARHYRRAGFIVVGRSSAPEFGLLPYTESEAYGPCRNPWDADRTPGGSSGGSASAVAARMVPIASAADGGGSIRIPASCCGLVGLKPTRSRTPPGGLLEDAWEGFIVEHAVSRTVRDSAVMLDALTDPGSGLGRERPFAEEVTRDPRRLRIAFTAHPLTGSAIQPHADCVAAMNDTAQLFLDLGHEVVEDAPSVDAEQLAIDFVTMLFGQVRNDIEEAARATGRRPSREQVELGTWCLGLLGNAMTAADYVRAVRRMERTAVTALEFFERYDMLLTPTLAMPPVRIGELAPTPAEQAMMNVVARTNAGWVLRALQLVRTLAMRTFSFIPYTPLFNVTGQPAMSVPLYWNAAGLPIGSHVVGRRGDEATLLQLAGQLERARPWAHRIPAIARLL